MIHVFVAPSARVWLFVDSYKSESVVVLDSEKSCHSRTGRLNIRSLKGHLQLGHHRDKATKRAIQKEVIDEQVLGHYRKNGSSSSGRHHQFRGFCV